MVAQSVLADVVVDAVLAPGAHVVVRFSRMTMVVGIKFDGCFHERRPRALDEMEALASERLAYLPGGAHDRRYVAPGDPPVVGQRT